MRDDFSSGVKMILAHRVGFRCSKPSCRALTGRPGMSSLNAKVNLGVAAHITAASSGGPRYDVTLPSEERSSVKNGIWLCENHAKEIDSDCEKYTIEILNSWKQDAEYDASSLLGVPISEQSFFANAEVIVHRLESNKIAVSGSTNLPEGTNLWVKLSVPSAMYKMKTCKVTISEGVFLAGEFGAADLVIPHCWCTVELLAYFNGPWKQPVSTMELVGRNGALLTGPCARRLDPDLADSHKVFNPHYNCIIPMLFGTAGRSTSDLECAIKLVQDSMLVVNEVESQMSISDIVNFYMQFSNTSEKDGWIAEASVNGSVKVVYSFWNGEISANAEWIVILDNSTVHYTNWYGKYMSKMYRL